MARLNQYKYFMCDWLLGPFYFVLMFDTSVPTEAGGRVNNIGLIADRQNGLIFSLGLAIIGTLLVVGGNFRNVPVKAEQAPMWPPVSPEVARRFRNAIVVTVMGTAILIAAIIWTARLTSPCLRFRLQHSIRKG
jgi:hypothetical protein